MYVCVLSPQNEIKKIIVYSDDTAAAAGEAAPELILADLTPKTAFSIMSPEIIVSSYHIHKDDSVSLIKNKIIRDLKNVLYEEIYAFIENTNVVTSAEWGQIYEYMTAKNNDEEPTPEMLRQVLANIPTLDIDVANSSYDDFVNLGRGVGAPSIHHIRIPLGFQYNKQKWNPLFSANPFQMVLGSQTEPMYMFDNELFLNYAAGGEATPAAPAPAAPAHIIYVCLAEDFFASAPTQELVRTYYPLLDKHHIYTYNELIVKRSQLENPADKLPLEDTIDVFYQIDHTPPQAAVGADFPPIEHGIKSFLLKIHPEYNVVLPLDAIFKILQTSKTMPFIKYNPASRRENLYRLYADKIAKNGKKIPYLARHEINNLARKIGKSKQIAMYVTGGGERGGEGGEGVELYCILENTGIMTVSSREFKRGITVDEMTAMIQKLVQPIIDQINENLGSSGYSIPPITSVTESGIFSKRVEIVGIKYYWSIAYNKKTKIENQFKKYDGCFYTLFEKTGEQMDFMKGQTVIYKRVENYQQMRGEKNMITRLFKTVGRNITEIVNELMRNYKKTEQEAVRAVAQYMDEINIIEKEGAQIDIVENPGFLTTIRLENFHLEDIQPNLVVEIDGITSFRYLEVLDVYIRNFYRIFLYPSSIPKRILGKVAATKIPTENKTGLPEREMKIIAAPVAPAAGPIRFAIAAAAAAAAAPAVADEEQKIQDVFDFYGEEDGEEEITAAAAADEDEDEEQKLQDVLDFYGDEEEEEEEEEDIEGGGDNDDDAGDDAGEADDENHDIPPENINKDFIKNMALTNPNPFLKRMKERDPVLFAVPKDQKKYKTYSRTCSSNFYRQPVILTQQEKDKIDKEYPNSYQHAIKYGSESKNSHWYICPRYWCLLTNTSMTEEDIRMGKCGNSTKIIPKGANNVPDDAFIYEFNDQGKEHIGSKGDYIQHYPGFASAAHPTNLKYPCCFKKWDPKLQKMMDEVAARGDAAVAAAPVAPPAAVLNPIAATAYVIGQDKTPVPHGRWGFLPPIVQNFLQTNNSACVTVDNPTVVKQNTACLLRYGVEENSFLGCIADIYAYKNNISHIPTIEQFRDILVRMVTVEKFMGIHSGELIKVFGDGAAANSGTAPASAPAPPVPTTTKLPPHITAIFKKSPATQTAVMGAMGRFIEYIKTTPTGELDYTYLWDLVCSPNTLLFDQGMNLAILEIPYNDVTGNIELLCPTNVYSKIPPFDVAKPTAIVIKTGALYEPIYLYNDNGDAIFIKKTFQTQNISENLKNIMQIIAYTTNRHCNPLQSMPRVYNFKRPVSLAEIVGRITAHTAPAPAPAPKIYQKIANYQGNIIGIMVEFSAAAAAAKRGFIPCSPAPWADTPAATYDAPILAMDEENVDWRDYPDTVSFLKYVALHTGLPCKPVMKVIDNGFIVGVLTETNQFVQIRTPTEDLNAEDDGLQPITGTNYITAEIATTTTTAQDVERIRSIKYIKLESSFYNTFRALVRTVLNKYENIARRKEILEIIEDNTKYTYKKKLAKIEDIIKRIVGPAVEFIEMQPAVLMEFDNITGCSTNCQTKKYCMATGAGATGATGATPECKLLVPKKHLIHNVENSPIYYGRITDELLRHKRIRRFMLQPKTFLNLSTIKYNITENEIILLQNTINTGDYFENLIPEKYNIPYSRAYPSTTQLYKNHFTVEEQGELVTQGLPTAAAAAAAIATTAAQPYIKDCIKEILEQVRGNVKSKWVRVLPNRSKEVIFKHTCSFAPMIYIFDALYQKYVSVREIKEKLVQGYNTHIENGVNFKHTILRIWKKEGKKEIAAKVEKGDVSMEDVIMGEEYYMTNIDIWVFADYITASGKLTFPVILFSALKIKDISVFAGEDIDWILLSRKISDKYFFIRSPTVFQNNTPPQYQIITPIIDIQNTNLELFQQRHNEEMEIHANARIRNMMSLRTYLTKLKATEQPRGRPAEKV